MRITPKPEQEEIISQAIQAGLIRNPEEALEIAVHTLQDRLQETLRKRPPGRKSLPRLFAESPWKGLDLEIERDPDPGRPIDL